jgi:CRISPR-associated exonuclease Cas4
MDEPVPIAALNQYAYCPHRCWRMFCAGEFVDNHYTLEGTGLHERVHTLGTDNRDGTWQVRAIWLRSERYGLVGKADLIEEADGQLYPVEYKRGQRGEFENDALQLCAQALCLEDMTGRDIPQGFIYYAQTNQRQPVPLTEDLREQTQQTIRAVRALLTTGQSPPAHYMPRCRGCSLYERCLPQAGDRLRRYQEAP